MNIKEGDKVKFLNDVGGGQVIRIIDKETAIILNDMGFEMPVLINELLPEPKITNYTLESKPAKAIVEKPKAEEKPLYTDNPEINFFLAFLPKDQNNKTDSYLDVYLINDSNYFVFYNYALMKGDKHESITGLIEPNLKEKISVYEVGSF